jgi:hypothetical protein
MLLEADDWAGTLMNKGYVRYWIGQAAETIGELTLAAICYRAAACIWENIGPPRATLPLAALESLIAAHPNLADVGRLGAADVERTFSTWLASPSSIV